MTLKLPKKSGTVVAIGTGMFLASALGATASAEFYRNTVSGEWTLETDTISEDLGSFEEEALWNRQEFTQFNDEGAGFALDVRQISVLFTFSGTEENPFSFDGDPLFPNYNGWNFRDVNGTIDAFESIEGVGKGPGDVDWDLVEVGIINDDEFYVNFNGIAGTDLVNGNSFRLVMSFVPAPAGALALIGVGFGLGGRRRRA